MLIFLLWKELWESQPLVHPNTRRPDHCRSFERPYGYESGRFPARGQVHPGDRRPWSKDFLLAQAGWSWPRGLECEEMAESVVAIVHKSPFSFYAVWFFIALLLPSALSAEPTYQSATLLGIERTVKITPMTYVFDVVATYCETVTYELQIQVGKEIYLTNYTPDIQPNWPLPIEWKVNRPIEVHTDKHRLFVKLSYDGEIVTYIARHTRAKTP
jgi:hypothetical protein